MAIALFWNDTCQYKPEIDLFNCIFVLAICAWLTKILSIYNSVIYSFWQRETTQCVCKSYAPIENYLCLHLSYWNIWKTTDIQYQFIFPDSRPRDKWCRDYALPYAEVLPTNYSNVTPAPGGYIQYRSAPKTPPLFFELDPHLRPPFSGCTRS